MSTRTDVDYLQDMLQYSEDAVALLQDRTVEELDQDNAFRYALQYCILIIGEAANHVSPATRVLLPSVAWREIVGMRNWLVHGYSKIRAQTVWDTAEQDLPKLIEAILTYLPPEQT